MQAFSVLGIQCRLVQRRGRPAAASAVRAAAPVQTPTLFFSSGGMPRKGRERGMKRGCMCTCIMSQDLSRGVLHTCAPSPHMRALAYAPPSMLATPCSAVTADKVDGAGGPQLRVPVVRGVLDVPPTAAVLSGARTSLGYARVSPGRTRASRRRRMPVVVWPAQQGMVMGVFGRSAKSSALLPPPSKTLRTCTNTHST